MSEASKTTKSTKFIGTLNNPGTHYKDFMAEDWLAEAHKHSGAVYTNGQLEKGKDGTVHLQYYMHFGKDKKTRVTALKKVCKHTHWTPIGKDNGADQYAMKEETRVEGPWEFGEKPLRQNVKDECRQARQEKYKLCQEKTLNQLVEDGDIDISQVPVVKRALDILTAERQQMDVKPLQGQLHEHNIWIYGDAGVGKTGWYVDYFTDNGGFYSKDKNKYWNGYTNEPNVLINDVENNDVDKSQFGNLKRWGEHQPFQAEDKYGTIKKIRPKHIVVTSNYHPRELWPNAKELEPILRRFMIVKMNGPYYPEGHAQYDPRKRANSFIPWSKPFMSPEEYNNKEEKELEVAASE